MKMRYYSLLLALTAATAAYGQKPIPDSTLVTIGYTKGDFSTLSGAIDKVTEERMNKGLLTSSLDALQGLAAGVQVTASGNQEAMVSAVRVRGTTSITGKDDPLVIIDGVTADLAILSTIYPADIESFTILKDASETAQYGSRGAAGVIEVATKKGRAQKFHISYDGSIGFESVFKRQEMLTADEFRRANQQRGNSFVDMGYDTNFNKEIERTGFVQNHHIAFGGGTEDANYRASVGVMEHETVIKTKGNTNYIAKLDINQKAFDGHLTVDLGMVGSLQKVSSLPNQQKLLYSASAFNPTFPSSEPLDGKWPSLPEATWIGNPLELLQHKQDENNGHFNVHVKAKVLITKALTLRAFGSYSYNSVANAHYYPGGGSEAYRGHEKSENLTGNASLTYIHEGTHGTLNLMALAEVERQKRTGFYVTTTGFATDAFGYDKLSAGANRPWSGTDSYYTDAHMQSLLFRAQYTLLGRYTLTANARGDASSKFGEHNRWGFFPSASAAWVISKEPWMRRFRHISNAKLRIGYGLSGSQAGIDSYNSMQLVKPNGVVPMNGSIATTLGIIRNANPDLKWEVKKSFNVGLDLSLWNRRVALTIDYYLSKTTDMLYVYDVPVPPFTYSKLLANLGAMENSGLEIGFGITPLHTRDMELTINMNWTFDRNKLISLDGEYNGEYITAPETSTISALTGAGFHGNSGIVSQIVGEQIGVFLLPHLKGFTTLSDGSRIYDVTEERYICGQAMPKAKMGSNIAFRYRHWDVTMQINGAFGHKIYNGTALTYNNMLSLPNYNVAKGASEKQLLSQQISDYYLESGDYANIDYLTVGWNVPVRSKYVQGLRLSVSVNNLATITGYSGLTPIINSNVINGTLGIDDKNVLPVYRSYTMGVSIKF